MDIRFSTAIHLLIMVSESEDTLTSEMIAKSVGTNASYIRKIIGLLKKSGIVESHHGKSGISLLQTSDELSLLDIYQSVTESYEPHLFDLHKNANDECVVGRYIEPVLTETFSEMEQSFASSLQSITLLDCINRMRKTMTDDEMTMGDDEFHR